MKLNLRLVLTQLTLLSAAIAANALQGNINPLKLMSTPLLLMLLPFQTAMADDIADNEFRIAAAAADMGFVTSTVGSVDNVPMHPGYDGAAHIELMPIL